MKLMIGILFMSMVMFVIVVAYAAILTTLTLLFTMRQKSTLRLHGLKAGGMPFDKLKALSAAEGFRVDTERRR